MVLLAHPKNLFFLFFFFFQTPIAHKNNYISKLVTSSLILHFATIHLHYSRMKGYDRAENNNNCNN